MTLTGIDLQSKIARFLSFRILGEILTLTFYLLFGYR